MINRASKRLLITLAVVVVAALMLLAYNAGQAHPKKATTQSNNPGWPAESASPMDEVNTPVAKPTIATGPDIYGDVSLAEVAADYLSGEQKLVGYYRIEGPSGWLWLNTEQYWFRPDAVYPYDTWTPEEIAASYLSDEVTWPNYYVSPNTNVLWSQDYEHIFVIRNHSRCYIDGEFVGTVPHRTHDMDPQALIAAYQSGDWDGKELLWSEDGSTYVQVQWRTKREVDYHRNGCLRYVFINLWEEGEAGGAGGNTAGGRWLYDRPWWSKTDAYEYERDMFDYQETKDGTAIQYDEVLIPLYIDLPQGQLPASSSYGNVIEIVPCNDAGILVFTDEGIWLFKRGAAALGWPSEDAAALLELGHTA